jgi:hypothetical protein
MSQLIIDAEDLISALENHAPESQYFLDLHTGEVVFNVDEAIVGLDDEFQALFDENPDRFHEIDPVPSSDGWQIMADFIEQMPAGDVRDRLIASIRGSHPFRRFKESLVHFPRVRDRWFAFHESAMLELARNWLNDENIDAELKIRAHS